MPLIRDHRRAVGGFDGCGRGVEGADRDHDRGLARGGSDRRQGVLSRERRRLVLLFRQFGKFPALHGAYQFPVFVLDVEHEGVRVVWPVAFDAAQN